MRWKFREGPSHNRRGCQGSICQGVASEASAQKSMGSLWHTAPRVPQHWWLLPGYGPHQPGSSRKGTSATQVGMSSNNALPLQFLQIDELIIYIQIASYVHVHLDNSDCDIQKANIRWNGQWWSVMLFSESIWILSVCIDCLNIFMHDKHK